MKKTHSGVLLHFTATSGVPSFSWGAGRATCPVGADTALRQCPRAPECTASQHPWEGVLAEPEENTGGPGAARPPSEGDARTIAGIEGVDSRDFFFFNKISKRKEKSRTVVPLDKFPAKKTSPFLQAIN